MNMKLKQWGATLIFFGIGSFVLPLVGMQFRIFNLFGAAQPIVAGGAIVVGGILLLVGRGGGAAAPSAAKPASAKAAPAKASPPSPPPPPKPAYSAAPGPYAADAFCGSCGQRLKPDDVFCGGCGAPAPASTAGPGVAYSKSPAACPICGQPECVGKEFCGNTGQRIGSPAAAAFTPSAAQPAAMPAAAPIAERKRFWSLGRVALLLFCILLLAGVGYFVVSSGLFHTAAQRVPPALPKAMAGTLTEFPVDTATSNPVKPTNVSIQALGKGAAPPELPPNSLPPGLTPAMLPGVGTSITSAVYKGNPQDPGVNVHVVDVDGDPAQATQQLAGTIESSAQGATATGVRVQSPTGADYTGVRIRTPQIEVYVLGKTAGSVVIVIYAPDPAVMATAERLAGNVGNAGGLNDYPGVTDSVGSLPATLPAGLELVELRTYSAADLGLSPQQIGQSLGGQLGDSGELASQAQRFMPETLVAARYRDARRKEFNVLVGEYGNTLAAWRTWSLLRWTAGLTGMTSIPVGDASGLTITQGGQEYVVFQTGSHLAVLAGPDEPAGTRVLQLAQALQF